MEADMMMEKKRVLLVSSDPVLQGFFQGNFSEGDYDLLSSKGASEQLRALLNTGSTDLVVVDVGMPSMEGIELCLCIRQFCQAPILMLSAWGAGKGRVRRLDLSADGYLTEPFGVSELLAQMDDALVKSGAARVLISDPDAGTL